MIDTIIEKLDLFFSKNDYESAEKYLLELKEKAAADGDKKILLFVLNELMGLNRKLARKDLAISYTEKALCLVKEMGIEKNVGAATTYLNSATVYKAFGRSNEGISLFEKAREIYENGLSKDDRRLAGLYNNMALALTDEDEFEYAESCYKKALEVLSLSSKNEGEMAITHLNLANLFEKQMGLENAQQKISQCIENAQQLLDKAYSETDGNYAFICEKCASTFGYYGYFVYENELKNRARRIYERA